MSSGKGENWRKQNETISSRLKFILQQRKFADATIVVQGNEFKCHRLILAMGSPYFERTFYHTFRHDTSTPIVISDVSVEAFRIVQNFLYTGKVTFGNEKQAFLTFEAADKFGMDDLKSECEIYLSELDIRPVTAWNCLNQAIQLKMQKLQKRCLTYVQNHTGECLRNPAFSSAPGEVVLDILKSEKLAVSESELLDHLVAWARYKQASAGSLRMFLLPYLKHIRFGSLTAKEFCAVIKDHPTIISSDDCLAILQYLELPYKNSLPLWCSSLPRRMWP